MEFQLMNLRKAAGFKSRKKFGAAIGESERRIKSWETFETRISLEDACKVADFLDCSLDELAGRWDYVGRYSDDRQRRLNQAFGHLDDSQKNIAVGAVEGMASEAAQEKTTRQGPVPVADTA